MGEGIPRMHIRPGFRATAVAIGALTAAAAFYAVGASADSQTYSVSGCRASLLQLSIGGNAVPIPSTSCPKGGDAFVPPIDVPLDPGDSIHAQVLYEYAAAAPAAGRHNAEAGVAKVVLQLQGHVISADVLTSQADCDRGQATGESQVVDLNLDGNHLTVPDTLQQPHHLVLDQLSPVVTIDMNRQDTSTSTATTTTAAGKTVTTTSSLTQTALEVKALIGTPLEVDLVVSQSHVDCAAAVFTPNPPPTTTPPHGPGPVVGWMSGGGQLANSETHSLVLPCTTTQKHPKAQLQVQTPAGTFRLDALSSASCTYDKSQGAPEQPDAGFNTLSGSGTGTCNGVSGVPVSFRFTDEGEPNKGADEAHITITDHACPVQADGTVNGNQQAHRGNNPPA